MYKTDRVKWSFERRKERRKFYQCLFFLFITFVSRSTLELRRLILVLLKKIGLRVRQDLGAVEDLSYLKASLVCVCIVKATNLFMSTHLDMFSFLASEFSALMMMIILMRSFSVKAKSAYLRH